MARYRSADGRVVEVQTNCREEVSARAVLVQLERRAELVRAGVLSAAEGDFAGHASSPFASHLDAYERHLRAKGGDARRIEMLRRRLERLADQCGFHCLSKMSAGPVESWLVEQADAGVGAVTRNLFRESLIGFCNFCRRTGRMAQNPFVDLSRANTRSDRRHQRRSLTQTELMRLLRTAALRPLAEYGRTIVASPPGKKKRGTWKRAPLAYENLDEAVTRACIALKDNPVFVSELEHEGRERSLIYQMLARTGLRRGELAALTIGQLDFSGRVAVVVLDPKHEKNRAGSTVPLRPDLASDLRAWLSERLTAIQHQCRRKRQPVPTGLTAETLLFDMPTGLNRIFDRDLAVAGIPKRDERNRVADIHALRVTFGTHLAIAGVPLRTAQAAMRHSKPELTANVYVDPKLIDVASAIATLPDLIIASPTTSAADNPA